MIILNLDFLRGPWEIPWSLGRISTASTLEKVLGQMKETILGIAEQRLQDVKICEATVRPPQTQREVCLQSRVASCLPQLDQPAGDSFGHLAGVKVSWGGAVASIKNCDLRQVPKCSTLFYDK